MTTMYFTKRARN